MKKNSFLRVYDLSHAHQANRASHVHEHGDPHQANDQGQPHLANNQGQPYEANNQGQTHKAIDQGQTLKANKQGQPHDNREQGPSLSLSTADEGNKTSFSSCQVGRQTGGACILKERVSDAALKSTGAGFFAEDWRSNLCRCPYCMVRELCMCAVHLLLLYWVNEANWGPATLLYWMGLCIKQVLLMYWMGLCIKQVLLMYWMGLYIEQVLLMLSSWVVCALSANLVQ